MDKKQYIKKRKSKKKDSPNDYSFYIPYLPDMKKRFLKNSLKWFFVVLASWLLWFLIFMYYPLTTMIDIEGKVSDYKVVYFKGRASSVTTYAIKLEQFASPIRHKKGFSVFHRKKMNIKLGDTLTIQIQKKDLEKLSNYIGIKPLSEYSKRDISKFPRFYGIKRHNEIMVSSAYALWNFPTPLTLGGLLQLVCQLITLIMIAALYTDGKKIYKINQWKKFNDITNSYE
jgi:hypothetical protein